MGENLELNQQKKSKLDLSESDFIHALHYNSLDGLLKSYYAIKKKNNKRFSYSLMARILGMKSRVHVYLIVSGKRKVSEKQVLKIKKLFQDLGVNAVLLQILFELQRHKKDRWVTSILEKELREVLNL